MKYKIEDGIPVPRGKLQRDGISAAIRSLDPGQSFFVPNRNSTQIGGIVSVLRRQGSVNFKVTSRATVEKNVAGVRVWRVETDREAAE